MENAFYGPQFSYTVVTAIDKLIIDTEGKLSDVTLVYCLND